VDWVHRWWAKARSLSPPWTRGGIDKRMPRRGGACAGVQPSAIPEHRSFLAGAENGGQSTWIPLWASRSSRGSVAVGRR
jgi:hypothetical protein